MRYLLNMEGSSVPRRLLILRHAKSSWADRFTDDWERPLTDRGRRDCARVGDRLRRLSLVPDIIITSDAVRAHTTALAVADAAGYAGKVVLSSSLYHAKPEAVIEVLRSAPDAAARAIMIVAHNPGLEDLVEQLTGEEVSLPTAALVNLAVHAAEWADLDATTPTDLVGIFLPADL